MLLDGMVLEGVVDTVAQIVLLIGLPLLLVLFYLEGIILGKVLQPPAVFVSVVAISRPSLPLLVFLCAGCTVTVAAGQWTVFRSFDPGAPQLLGLRETWPRLEELPGKILDRIGERRLAIMDSIFDRYGAIAVFASTFLPLIRGSLAVPAGMSAYPVRRFLTVTILANALYFPLLVGIAFGILRLLGF